MGIFSKKRWYEQSVIQNWEAAVVKEHYKKGRQLSNFLRTRTSWWCKGGPEAAPRSEGDAHRSRPMAEPLGAGPQSLRESALGR